MPWTSISFLPTLPMSCPGALLGNLGRWHSTFLVRCPTYTGPGMSEPLEDIKGVLLDLDGTIFVGDRLIPGAADAVDTLRRGGLPLRFGTNTTRSRTC